HSASASRDLHSFPTRRSSDLRARALRRVAENAILAQKEFDPAFVLMQYFGYLRRDPNSGSDRDFSGYNFWLTKLNTFNGNYQNRSEEHTSELQSRFDLVCRLL